MIWKSTRDSSREKGAQVLTPNPDREQQVIKRTLSPDILAQCVSEEISFRVHNSEPGLGPRPDPFSEEIKANNRGIDTIKSGVKESSEGDNTEKNMKKERSTINRIQLKSSML